MKGSAALRFCELLLVLLKGKTSIVDSLHILEREGIEKEIRDSVSALLAAMKKGKGLSESLRAAQGGKVFFEPLHVTLIAAAEITGNIEGVLERIVSDLRRKHRVKENAINILVYPSIIVLAAVAGTIALIVKGMPFFIAGGLLSASVISDAKAGISIAGMVLLSGGGALFIFYFRIFYNDSPEFRIFYLLDFLLRSNITLTEALSHCIACMGRTKYGKALVSARKDIASGITFQAAFGKIPYFPPYVAGWLSVVGASGRAGEVCGNIKEYYARKDGKTREIAAKLIEPAVIALTGIYVLIIMLTVILPILTYAGGSL